MSDKTMFALVFAVWLALLVCGVFLDAWLERREDEATVREWRKLEAERKAREEAGE